MVQQKVWTLESQLDERLAAIEAVATALPGTKFIEHLVQSLADFLLGSGLERRYIVEQLVNFLACHPPRYGSHETVSFLLASLEWDELEAAITALSYNPHIDRRIRHAASDSLKVLRPDFTGFGFRTFTAGWQVEVSR